MSTRLSIAALIFPMASAVLFGAGVVPVMAVTGNAEHLSAAFPWIVAGSFLLAAPASWFLAPRLRARPNGTRGR